MERSAGANQPRSLARVATTVAYIAGFSLDLEMVMIKDALPDHDVLEQLEELCV